MQINNINNSHGRCILADEFDNENWADGNNEELLESNNEKEKKSFNQEQAERLIPPPVIAFPVLLG